MNELLAEKELISYEKDLKPYTAGKISTENLLDNVLTYISEHFCFYTLCIISAYKYVNKLRKCK